MNAALLPSRSDHMRPLRLAMLAIDEVRQHLGEYADTTDRPAWEAVQAADLLDTVAELLAKAGTP